MQESWLVCRNIYIYIDFNCGKMRNQTNFEQNVEREREGERERAKNKHSITNSIFILFFGLKCELPVPINSWSKSNIQHVQGISSALTQHQTNCHIKLIARVYLKCNFQLMPFLDVYEWLLFDTTSQFNGNDLQLINNNKRFIFRSLSSRLMAFISQFWHDYNCNWHTVELNETGTGVRIVVSGWELFKLDLINRLVFTGGRDREGGERK